MAYSISPFAKLDQQQHDGWSDSENESSDDDWEAFRQMDDKIKKGNEVGKDGQRLVKTTTPEFRRQETTWITQQMRLIERDYFIDKDQVLGEPGQFGTAFLCWRHPTSFEQTKPDWLPKYRCVKYINKARLSLVSEKQERVRIFKTLAREIGVLKCVDHPNIVQLFDVYESRDEIHLVMEYLPGGELFDRIAEREESYSEQEAANIVFVIYICCGFVVSFFVCLFWFNAFGN